MLPSAKWTRLLHTRIALFHCQIVGALALSQAILYYFQQTNDEQKVLDVEICLVIQGTHKEPLFCIDTEGFHIGW